MAKSARKKTIQKKRVAEPKLNGVTAILVRGDGHVVGTGVSFTNDKAGYANIEDARRHDAKAKAMWDFFRMQVSDDVLTAMKGGGYRAEGLLQHMTTFMSYKFTYVTINDALAAG